MLQFNATFFAAMFSFILFIIIMNKILYQPIGKIIAEREEFINKTESEAQNLSSQADNIQKEREEKLSNASRDAKKIVSDNVSEANKKAKELTDEAKKQSSAKILSAKNELNNEAEQTKEILKGNIKDLAENISHKILGEYTSIDNIDNDLVNKVIN